MRERDTPSLILGAMDADMAPPRSRFDGLWKGLRPVRLTTNSFRSIPLPPCSKISERLWKEIGIKKPRERVPARPSVRFYRI